MSEMNEKEIKKRLEQISQFEISPEVTSRDLERVNKSLTKLTDEPQESGQDIWSIIMKSKFMKIAAAFVIVSIILITISILSNSSTPFTAVAFGDVLSQIRNSNYTFDLKVLLDNNGEKVEGVTNHAQILQPGKMRLDAPELNVSTITDFSTGRSILLWHDRKTVQIISENAQNLVVEESPFNILTDPIEKLWNLQDGSEIELGEKEIDGQIAYGFEIQERNKLISYNMIVWADSQTGDPIHVEINNSNPENPAATMTFIMNNFNMNAELDPVNFSMEIPEDYTLENSN